MTDPDLTTEVSELFRDNALAVAQRIVEMALTPTGRNAVSTLRAAEIILESTTNLTTKTPTKDINVTVTLRLPDGTSQLLAALPIPQPESSFRILEDETE